VEKATAVNSDAGWIEGHEPVIGGIRKFEQTPNPGANVPWLKAWPHLTGVWTVDELSERIWSEVLLYSKW